MKSLKSLFVVTAILFFASDALSQCTAVPPVCVDINSYAYQTVIDNDPFCCTGAWDAICEVDYDNLSSTCTSGQDGYGCTDPLALNYDPAATIDNGQCIYPCVDCGCTNPEALNYDPAAVTDDGSCVFPMPTGLIVEQNLTPEELVFNLLLGEGILVSNVVHIGAPSQIGEFYQGDGIGMESGIVMSTAYATNIELPGGWLEPTGAEGAVNGYPDLLTVANSVPPLIGQNFTVGSVNHVCALEFDFIPFGDNVSFNYLFGSNEYLAWVNTTFNDVFAFFLSGPGIDGPYSDGGVNLATVPGSDPPLPITVSSVNNNTNSQYYNHNIPSTGVLAINGYTDMFTAQYQGLIPGEIYHIRMAIADGSDSILESIVLLQAGSFTSEVPADGNSADFNGDGVVNVLDLYILLADFGCVAPPECIGDLNGDGSVNFADILIFLDLFGG